MASCFCHRPSMASPSGAEKQPVPVRTLPVAPPPVLLAPHRAANSLPARPRTPPPSAPAASSAGSDGASSQRSPSRHPIPKIPDFEGLVDSGTDSDDELLQLSRAKPSSYTASSVSKHTGPKTPKKSGASGAGGDSVPSSLSLSPLSSLMSHIGNIGRGSPSRVGSHYGQTPETAKSADDLAMTAHRAEVRRLAHKRMQEELQKELQPYSSHSYKKSSMSTIREDAVDASTCSSAALRKPASAVAPGDSAPQQCAENAIEDDAEDRPLPIAVSRKLKMATDTFLSKDRALPTSDPALPPAFALQSNSRINLLQGLALRSRDGSSHSRSFRDWIWSPFVADKSEKRPPVGEVPIPPQVPPKPEAQGLFASKATISAVKGKRPERQRDNSNGTVSHGSGSEGGQTAAKSSPAQENSGATASSLSLADEDGSIHEACKARVVSLGRLPTTTVHSLGSGKAALDVTDTGKCHQSLHPSVTQTAKHGRESSDISQISTLNLPSPCIETVATYEEGTKSTSMGVRQIISHGGSRSLSLPSRCFDHAVTDDPMVERLPYRTGAVQVDGASSEAGKLVSRTGFRSLRAHYQSKSLVGDLEQMSDDWHRQLDQIRRGSPVLPAAIHKMRLSHTWPPAKPTSSSSAGQVDGSQDPFQTSMAASNNSHQSVDGCHAANRHTVAIDMRDMSDAWWQAPLEVTAKCENLGSESPAEATPPGDCHSDQKEAAGMQPQCTTEPRGVIPAISSIPSKFLAVGLEKAVRTRLGKFMYRKQDPGAIKSSPPSDSLRQDTVPCDQETENPSEVLSTMVEASASKDDVEIQEAGDSGETSQPANMPSTPESRRGHQMEPAQEAAQEQSLSNSPAAETITGIDSIFGSLIYIDNGIDNRQGTDLTTPEKKAAISGNVGTPSPPPTGQKPLYSVPSTPVAAAYAEVRAYISDAFPSPAVPTAIAEVQRESPSSSSYRDAVSSHDVEGADATHLVSRTTERRPSGTFSLRSERAPPQLTFDSATPASKFKTWEGRVNPTQPRLMKSTAQFSAELESLFLGKKKESKENSSFRKESVSRAIPGLD